MGYAQYGGVLVLGVAAFRDKNTARIVTVIQELPTRIISIERLQILQLTLQNSALHVQRRERELQMQTVRRVLLREDEDEAPEPSPLLVQALSRVEALVGGTAIGAQ